MSVQLLFFLMFVLIVVLWIIVEREEHGSFTDVLRCRFGRIFMSFFSLLASVSFIWHLSI